MKKEREREKKGLMTCSPQPTTLRRVCTFGATKDEQEKGLDGASEEEEGGTFYRVHLRNKKRSRDAALVSLEKTPCNL